MEKGDFYQLMKWAANPNTRQNKQHFVTAGIVTLPVSFKAGKNSQDTPSLPQCCRERFVRHFRS